MKLSVFVVTYNQEQYIRQCLDSVVMQQVDFDYEVIIGEDCSTDNTPLICDEYAKKYPFIRVYHHSKNLGLVKNWEFVLNHCKGDYIAMLEGDDYWIYPCKLQKQLEYMEMHPEVVLTFTGVNVSYEGGDIRDEHIFDHLASRIYSIQEIYKKWSILTSTVVFRKGPMLPIIYPQEVFINDTYTFMRIMQYGMAYCFAEPWTTYRRHGSNVSRIESAEFSARWVIQHRYIGRNFPILKKIAQGNEIAYLNTLIYNRSSKDTWRYRLRYIWLNKHLFFSRFMLSTVKYFFM